MNHTLNIEDGQILIAEKIYKWEYKENELIREDEKGRTINHVKYFTFDLLSGTHKGMVIPILEIKDFDIHMRRDWWTMSLYNQDPVFDRLYNLGMMEAFENRLVREYQIFDHVSFTHFLLGMTTVDLFTHLVNFLQED